MFDDWVTGCWRDARLSFDDHDKHMAPLSRPQPVAARSQREGHVVSAYQICRPQYNPSVVDVWAIRHFLRVVEIARWHNGAAQLIHSSINNSSSISENLNVDSLKVFGAISFLHVSRQAAMT